MVRPRMRIRAIVLASALFAANAPFVASADAGNSANPGTPSGRIDASPPLRPSIAIAIVRVVLDEQRAYVYAQDRRLVATLLVSTGLNDSTPVGRFRVFSKSESTFYAPNPAEKMRWMVRFVRDPKGGHIGFHSIPYRIRNGREVKIETPVGVAPSSHGCVRVRDLDAKWLFDNMSLGAVVIVQRARA